MGQYHFKHTMQELLFSSLSQQGMKKPLHQLVVVSRMPGLPFHQK
jgi:hypothetical protein